MHDWASVLSHQHIKGILAAKGVAKNKYSGGYDLEDTLAEEKIQIKELVRRIVVDANYLGLTTKVTKSGNIGKYTYIEGLEINIKKYDISFGQATFWYSEIKCVEITGTLLIITPKSGPKLAFELK